MVYDGKEMEFVVIFVIIWTEIEDSTIAFDNLFCSPIFIIIIAEIRIITDYLRNMLESILSN